MSEPAVSAPHLEIRVVVFTLQESRLKVLLIPAADSQFSGKWTLPDAPILDCALEKAAARRIEQLTGVGEVYLEQLYTYGDPGRHPACRLISIVYFALIPADSLKTASDSKPTSRWYALEELPPLAMDHNEILTYALRRLRYKLEYTAVGFELLPEFFTLSELQHTYELILGEKLDKRNFRRRILEAGIIEATPHRRSGEGRPALLYRYRPDAVAEVKARRLFP
ncbi:MAG: NUDIX domain-containing protein [Bellilinea sp.]|nr:NUDIX domain-containing protein [Bellilinea sp.]